MAAHSSTLAWKIPWTEEPGRLQSMGPLRVRHDWVRNDFSFSLSHVGEGNGNPLQCSSLENPRDGKAWWAAVYVVSQSGTRLKWLSSSSSVLFWSLWVCWFYHFVLHLSDSAFSLFAKQFVVVEHLSCQVPRWVLRGTFSPRAGSHPSSQCTALREEELSVICRFPLARRPSWKTDLWWKDFPLGYALNGVQHQVISARGGRKVCLVSGSVTTAVWPQQVSPPLGAWLAHWRYRIF